MRLEKSEIAFFKKHIKTIEQIVRTASCSNITPEYRTGLVTIGKKYKLMDCSTCNSSLYLGTCRIYNLYLKTLEELKREKTQNKNGKQTGTEKEVQGDIRGTSEQ